jgi:hypothetical protein
MRKLLSILWLIIPMAILCSCGGKTGTVNEQPDLELTDVERMVDLPVVFPDVNVPEDILKDGLEVDGTEINDMVPDLPWEPQPCQSHSDCEDGFCVEIVAGSGEFFCAPTCIEECPGDWLCKAIFIDGSDPVSICLPGDGCQGVVDGTLCNGSDPCKKYSCDDGFCVGTKVEFDLIPDGVDEDCDGQTDEDAYLGFRLLGGSFECGSGKPSGGGWTLTGTVSASGYAGVSSSDGVSLIPGAP